MVLLVFGNQIVHVGFSLSELHLVHTLPSVPMQESLSPEHGSELVTNSLEKFLDRGRVADKGGRHLETTGRNGAESGLDIVGDPLNEVRVVLVLDVAHLVLNFLHGDLTTAVYSKLLSKSTFDLINLQDGRASEIAAVAKVGSSHHVLGVEHLLGQLRNSNSTEGVRATAGEGSESNHEKVETRERNHVDSQFAEIRVELAREAETSGNTRHDSRDQVVKISIRWVGELEGSHANVVERLVVNTEGLVRVLDQLVDGKSGVVGLDNGVRDLGGWNDGESSHHTVGELFTDLGDQKRTHTGTSSTTEGVGDLETLEAVTSLSFATNNVKNLVDKLSTLSIMTFSPVVASAGLTENEVVGAEELTEWASADGIHGTWLQIDEDGTRDILVAGSLAKPIRNNTITRVCMDIYLVEVDVHAFELKVRRAVVPEFRVS